MDALKLPTTYEDIRSELQTTGEEYIAKLMEFVKPVEDAEKELTEIAAQMGPSSGRAVLLLGVPGSGKSTFIESLVWRTHLGFSHLEQIDCETIDRNALLDTLLDRIRLSAQQSPARRAGTYVAIAINYLENLDGQPEDRVKSFFRTLNGILRKNPVFIIWPVTREADASRMLQFAADVSGTVFHPGKEIVHFVGPKPEDFAHIAKNTIAVMNDGRMLEDFGLTDADLTEMKLGLLSHARQPQTIRHYLELVATRWRERSDYIKSIHATIPKPSEVWFVLAYREAEDVVGQFVRRGEDIDSAWIAFHSKLWEYIPNSQRAADWDPKRLQLALSGVFTTRIMYLPTNALVAAVAAFIDKGVLDLTPVITQPRWLKQSAAVEQMASTPLIRQLRREKSPPGKRKGGPAAQAKTDAKPAFERIASFVASSGNDRYVNRAVADAIQQALDPSYRVVAEAEHPWLPSICPDIRVDVPGDRHVCIEFHYTSRTEPYVLADYVLKKLDRYMRQLEYFAEQRGVKIK